MIRTLGVRRRTRVLVGLAAFGHLTVTSRADAAQGGQPSLASVTFSPPTVPGGTTATATIALTGPAGNNGFEISLSITSNVASLTSSTVTIGSGLSSIQVAVTTTTTATLQLATLSATARGDTRSGSLTVAPPAVRAIVMNPARLIGAQTTSGSITLDGAAPTGGTIVTLSSNSAALTVPGADTVVAGQTSTTFSATSQLVESLANATVTAIAGGTVRTATVSVSPLPPLAVSSITVFGTPFSGGKIDIRVLLNRPAPPGGVIVQLTTTAADLIQSGAPGVDTVRAGALSMQREIRFYQTPMNRPFTVTATAGGASVIARDSVRGPQPLFMFVEGGPLIGGTRRQLRVLFTGDIPLPGGVPIAFTSNTSAFQVVAPGRRVNDSAMDFDVDLALVAQTTSGALTAALNGRQTTLSFSIFPQPVLTALSLAPTVARPGRTVSATVTLERAAPPGGAQVSLTAAGLPPGFVVPASISLAQGATTASVSTQVPSLITTSVTVTLVASLYGVSKTATLRIDP